MSHLDSEDIKAILAAIEAHELEKETHLHAENFHGDGSPKVHTHSVKKRAVSVVVVLVVMHFAGRAFHVEVIFKMIEIGVVSFFDWWINGVKEGEFGLGIRKVMFPKLKLPGKKKKAEPTEVE